MKFSSQAALEVVKMTTSSAACDGNIVKTTIPQSDERSVTETR